ncbi:hypothetical protein Tco_0157158 [Tanacetum coccineum]
MAQQQQPIIPADQLVPKFQSIGRCNNYVFWKTVGKVLDTEDTIRFKLDIQEIVYTVDMFCSTLNLLVKTTANPFIAPIIMKYIQPFMQIVGYQGDVDKVSAFFTKNLAQPWKTMFKVFNRCLTSRTSGHDKTKINILEIFHVVINRVHVDYAALLWWDFLHCVQQKKDQIQYPHFTKLIIANLMKKFSSIPQRLEEDYHSIKDDIPLVSVYTTGNVTVRGMLISDEFFTDDIRATKEYKEYIKVFVGVDARFSWNRLNLPRERLGHLAPIGYLPLLLLLVAFKEEGERERSFGKKGKLAPRFVGPFEIIEKVGRVAYLLDLPEELNGVHDTFHVSNLMKCLADTTLKVNLDKIRVDAKLNFVEDPVEILEREFKKLKRSRIAIVKVRWNSKRGPEFTWERKDQMKLKYPDLFSDVSS